jgi:hypothetical protein
MSVIEGKAELPVEVCPRADMGRVEIRGSAGLC